MPKNINLFQKWMDLKDRIIIVYKDKPRLLTAKKLNDFKLQFDLVLPQEYLNFLYIFGEGEMEVAEEYTLPSEIRFRLPNIQWSKLNISWSKDFLMSQNRIFMGHDYGEEIDAHIELLNNAFVFGDSSRSELFMFDLRTYNIEDDSYDIHKTYINSTSSVFIGRNFYDFINDYSFCNHVFQIVDRERLLQKKQIRCGFRLQLLLNSNYIYFLYLSIEIGHNFTDIAYLGLNDIYPIFYCINFNVCKQLRQEKQLNKFKLRLDKHLRKIKLNFNN